MWDVYSASGDYDWQLTLENPIPGEFCSIPHTASAGINHSNHSASEFQWFEYTAPGTGRIVISAECNDVTENAIMAVFDTCVPEYYLEDYIISSLNGFCGDSSHFSFACTNGSVYKIVSYLDDGGEFDWNLTFIPDVNNLIEITSGEDKIMLYPNPNNGRFRLSISEKINSADLCIMNLSGQVVYTTMINNSHQELDLSFLNAGLYTVIIRDGKFIAHEKLLINK